MGKRIVCLLLCVCMLIATLSGCGTKKSEIQYTEKPLEEVFNKTIHDFEGYVVENLNKDENSNFVVYEENVRQIHVSNNTNVLVDIDYEKMTYSFTNADETLRSLQKGDVLYGKATQENPEMIVAKVKKIEMQGDTLVVYSDEVSLADLFVYADVNMSVPVLEDTEESAQEQSYRDGMLSAHTLNSDGMRDTVRLEKLNTNTIRLNKTLSTALNIKNGVVGVTGSASVTFQSVTLKFQFSSEHMLLYCAYWCDYQTAFQASFSVEGNVVNEAIPLLKVPVTVAGIPIMLNTNVCVNISGSVGGNFSYTETGQKGTQHYVSPAGVQNIPINEIKGTPKKTAELLRLEGSFSLGVELKPTLQFGFIGKIYASAYKGMEATGSIVPIEIEQKEEYPDTRHECPICVDGDINDCIRISCGLEIKLCLLKRKTSKMSDEVRKILQDNKKGLEQIQPAVTLIERSTKKHDFYISLNEEDAEFGWGECPYIGYRTSVTVKTEEGILFPEAVVGAVLPNEREVEAITNEDGIAIIYLPNGEHTLKAQLGGQRGSENITIEDSPAEIEITMRAPKLYILHKYFGSILENDNKVSNRFFSSSEFPSMCNFLQERYPNAYFIEAADYSVQLPDLCEGDIVACFTASRILNQEYQEGCYAATPFEAMDLDIKIKTEEELELVVFIYKGISKSWSIPEEGSLYTFGGAWITTNIYYDYSQLYTGAQESYEEPCSLKYAYVLDYINDKAGVQNITLGFIRDECAYLDAVIESQWGEVTR